MAVVDGTFVARVNAEAKEIHFWRTVATFLAAVLYGIGWVIGKAFVVAWLALTWTYAAAKVGFQDAHGSGGVKRKASG